MRSGTTYRACWARDSNHTSPRCCRWGDLFASFFLELITDFLERLTSTSTYALWHHLPRVLGARFEPHLSAVLPLGRSIILIPVGGSISLSVSRGLCK